jgi:hypothetical protein
MQEVLVHLGTYESPGGVALGGGAPQEDMVGGAGRQARGEPRTLLLLPLATRVRGRDLLELRPEVVL